MHHNGSYICGLLLQSVVWSVGLSVCNDRAPISWVVSDKIGILFYFKLDLLIDDLIFFARVNKITRLHTARCRSCRNFQYALYR